MTTAFDYFVVLAGMRTGSNLLEEQLAAMPGVVSHGELFNPHFFGKPETNSMWGLSMTARDSDPVRVIGAMRETSQGLHGFRLFYDHDERAIDYVLSDRRAAKIILTRRPIDSYVSLKIARKTGQWWLGDMTSARAAKVPFDAEEYADFLNDLSEFQFKINNTLQTTGQTAFHIAYEDLSDDDVLAGLGLYLGSDGPPDPEKVRAKVQNPTPVTARLTNPRVAEEALQALSAPDLGRLPVYEPDRGPGLRFFRACRSAPLLYMPIRGAGLDPVPDWLKQIDPDQEIESGMSQKDLRRWKRKHPGHRSFSVLRHPLSRAHDAFSRFILQTNIDNYAAIRLALIDQYNIPLPKEWPTEAYDLAQHQEAFLAFLEFLAGNLGGQTALRVDNTWATQTTLLHAVGQFAVPDRIIREEALAAELAKLASDVGVDAPPLEGGYAAETPFSLVQVYSKEIEAACAKAYRRDYVMFGFEAWSETQAA
ncbi:MAG: nodulation protein NodH [Silicimonas sp.]|nr:nodulation protein NodH [Silicimonas sp.]